MAALPGLLSSEGGKEGGSRWDTSQGSCAGELALPLVSPLRMHSYLLGPEPPPL